MYQVVKSWDNRAEVKSKKLPTIKGRTWTRRIQWLEDPDNGIVKLKFDDGAQFTEAGVLAGFAQIVWDRFKEGQSIDDSLSIYRVRHVQSSKRGTKK